MAGTPLPEEEARLLAYECLRGCSAIIGTPSPEEEARLLGFRYVAGGTGALAIGLTIVLGLVKGTLKLHRLARRYLRRRRKVASGKADEVAESSPLKGQNAQGRVLAAQTFASFGDPPGASEAAGEEERPKVPEEVHVAVLPSSPERERQHAWQESPTSGSAGVPALPDQKPSSAGQVVGGLHLEGGADEGYDKSVPIVWVDDTAAEEPKHAEVADVDVLGSQTAPERLAESSGGSGGTSGPTTKATGTQGVPNVVLGRASSAAQDVVKVDDGGSPSFAPSPPTTTTTKKKAGRRSSGSRPARQTVSWTVEFGLEDRALGFELRFRVGNNLSPMVSRVVEGSAASRGDLRMGDRVVAANGRSLVGILRPPATRTRSASPSEAAGSGASPEEVFGVEQEDAEAQERRDWLAKTFVQRPLVVTFERDVVAACAGLAERLATTAPQEDPPELLN